MIARIEFNVERAVREAMGYVAHAEVDQIEPIIGQLHEVERAYAFALCMLIACYVVVDACGNQWPDDANLRQVADALSSTGTTARLLGLDADEIYEYLSRVAFGPETLSEVIPDEPAFTRLPIIVAQRAAVVFSPKEMGTWEYLDKIESAIDIAWALDRTVLAAAVVRAYLPKPGIEPGAANQVEADDAASQLAGSDALVLIARQFASSGGEPNPAAMRYVATTRQKANDLTGATANTDQPVFLVEVRGNFSLVGSSHPQGSPAPQGTILILTVEAATGLITNWGMTDAPLPLEQLGPVHDLAGSGAPGSSATLGQG